MATKAARTAASTQAAKRRRQPRSAATRPHTSTAEPSPLIALPKLTAAQRNILAAFAAAQGCAQRLRVFATPASAIDEEDAGDYDPLFFAIERLATKFFEGGADLEETLADTALTPDDRLYVHQMEVRAHERAAFALGVAWGRLERER